MRPLSQRARELLDFERENPGQKERLIRQRFGISAARYHHELNAVLDTPEALTFDPVMVGRLRRIREARRRKRHAQRVA